MAHKIRRRETKRNGVKWDGVVFAGTDPKTGKPKCIQRTFDRKKDCEDWLEEQNRLRRRQGGQLPVATDETFAEWLQTWLADKERGKIKRPRGKTLIDPRTMHDYRDVVRRWIIAPPEGVPAIGAVRLDRLRREHLEALYDHLWDRGLATTSIRAVHGVFLQALDWAVRRNKIMSNPAYDAAISTRPKDDAEGDTERKVKAKAMTRDQGARFYAAARHDRYYALWLLLLYGGLRPSEAYGLTWPEVDFQSATVHVRRTLKRRGIDREKHPEGWALGRTKNDTSIRSVPLPEVVMKELGGWRMRQEIERETGGSRYKGNDVELVFTTDIGTPLDETNLGSKNYRRILAAANLGTFEPAPPKPKGQPGPRKQPRFVPAFRIYDLRHTCATWLLDDGIPLKVVSERLGHASTKTTENIYQHTPPTMQEEVVRRQQAWFAEAD